MPDPTWREIPASTCEAILFDWNEGHYPPSLDDLEDIAHRLGFRVSYWPKDFLRTAVTNHQKNEIFIVLCKPEVMQRMLIHEVVEILLRRPLAEEFAYPHTGRDEFHEVATIVHQRI